MLTEFVSSVVPPPRFGVTTTVSSTLVLAASVPRSHTIVPLALLQLPCEVVTETRLTPIGRTLLRMTPLAIEGPTLLTTIE